MMQFDWTDDRIAEAKRLYAEGLPHSAIGRALGCSRNAVIGKLSRLGIAGEHGSNPRHRGHHTGTRSNMPKYVRLSGPTKPVVLPPPTVVLEPLGPSDEAPPRGFCQYTADDIAIPGWRMCGRPSKPGESWCEAHHGVVFVPASQLGRSNQALAKVEEAEAIAGSKRIFG